MAASPPRPRFDELAIVPASYELNSGGSLSSVADLYWGRQVNTGVWGQGLGVRQQQRWQQCDG